MSVPAPPGAFDFFARCPAPAALVSFDGQVVAANQAWLPATGWSPADLEGRSLLEFLHGSDLEPAFTDPAAIRRGALSGTWDARWVCRDGLARWLSWDVAADHVGRLYVCVARQLAADELRRQERFKADFINMAAHELNTPLTPIQLALETLGMRFDPVMDRDVMQGIGLVQRNFERLRDLVAELLDSARMHAGRLPLQLRETDLGALVREAAQANSPAEAEPGVTLRIQADEGLRCVLDAARVRQVVDNYLACGLAMAAPGSEVRLRAERLGGQALVTMECGESANLTVAQREALFRPFPPSEEPTPGPRAATGLGLYLARGIVELHGGRVAAREGPTGGLVLSFLLPLEGPASQPPSSQPNVGSPQARPEEGQVDAVPSPSAREGRFV